MKLSHQGRCRHLNKIEGRQHFRNFLSNPYVFRYNNWFRFCTSDGNQVGRDQFEKEIDAKRFAESLYGVKPKRLTVKKSMESVKKYCGHE